MLKSHPIIYDFIESLRKENKRTEDNLIKAKTGLVNKRNGDKMLMEKRLVELLSNYDKKNTEEFFTNLALIVKY